MPAPRTWTFEWEDGEHSYRIEAELVSEHFGVRGRSGRDLVPLDRLTDVLSRIEGPNRASIEALIAVDDCTIDGIPIVKGLGTDADPQAALRSSIAAALGPNGSDETLATRLRHALPRDQVVAHRVMVAQRTGGILAMGDRKAKIVELLLRLEESAEQASKSFKSQFSLFTGAHVRRMKTQIGAIAAEFRGDFEYLGFPQVDVSSEGSSEGLARKCEAVRNRAAAVSAAYRLGPGSLPFGSFAASVAEAVALTVVDTEILEPALSVWSKRAAAARRILGIEIEEVADRAIAGDNGTLDTSEPETEAAASDEPTFETSATTARCRQNRDESIAETIGLVRRRLGENIAAQLEAVAAGRGLSRSERDDLHCALDFLATRNPKMKPALDRMTSSGAASRPTGGA